VKTASKENSDRLAKLTGANLIRQGLQTQEQIVFANRQAATKILHERASILSAYEGCDFGVTIHGEHKLQAARDFFDAAVHQCIELGIDVESELRGKGYLL